MSGQSTGSPLGVLMEATGAMRLVMTQSLRHALRGRVDGEAGLFGDRGPARRSRGRRTVRGSRSASCRRSPCGSGSPSRPPAGVPACRRVRRTRTAPSRSAGSRARTGRTGPASRACRRTPPDPRSASSSVISSGFSPSLSSRASTTERSGSAGPQTSELTQTPPGAVCAKSASANRWTVAGPRTVGVRPDLVGQRERQRGVDRPRREDGRAEHVALVEVDVRVAGRGPAPSCARIRRTGAGRPPHRSGRTRGSAGPHRRAAGSRRSRNRCRGSAGRTKSLICSHFRSAAVSKASAYVL